MCPGPRLGGRGRLIENAQTLVGKYPLLRRSGSCSRSGSDRQLKGVVKINAPPSLSFGFLASRFAELSTRHSGFDINLATDFRNVSHGKQLHPSSLRHSPTRSELWIVMRRADMKDAPIKAVVDHLIRL
jgi:hypothetical protein